MTQRCPDCEGVEILTGNGNGKCSNCYGGGKVGTITDDIAGGKRACPQCHGSGQCQTCGGHGVVSAKLTRSTLAKAFRGELVPTEAKLAEAEVREFESAKALLERISRQRQLGSRPKGGNGKHTKKEGNSLRRPAGSALLIES